MTPFYWLTEIIKTYPSMDTLSPSVFEVSIQPRYQNLNHYFSLTQGKKLLWCLRKDQVLTIEIDDPPFEFEKMDNRAEEAIYCEGWLCKADHLEVSLFTGPYERLSLLEREYLERYICLRLMEQFNEEKIIFKNELFVSNEKIFDRVYVRSDMEKENLFDLAIQHNQDDLTLLLFRKDAPIPAAIAGKCHVVHTIARSGAVEDLEKILKGHPFLIHLQDQYQKTPLSWAVISGQYANVDYLIAQGSHLNIPPDEDHLSLHFNPLDWAIQSGQFGLFMLLIGKGAKANYTHLKINGKTFEQAIKKNLIDIVKIFIKQGKSDLNTLNQKGYAPLHYAVKYGFQGIAQLLIKFDAQIDVMNTEGMTPLMIAAKKNNHEILKMLLYYGAKNPFSPNAETPLSKKYSSNHDALTRFILTKTPRVFRPHRHVKIWLSPHKHVFMNDENQLRLVQMRASCPNDEISLVFDSQLLNESALHALFIFCIRNDIQAIDVQSLLPMCDKNTERSLINIYEDEITHLSAGGNLAAASDILRWLSPVFNLGVYSDFDVIVSTQFLPEHMMIFEDLIFNAGSLLYQDLEQNEKLYASNDVLAILNPHSSYIDVAHQFILEACAASPNPPKGLGCLEGHFLGIFAYLNQDLNQLKQAYFEKTPRQFRSALPDLITNLHHLANKIYPCAPSLKHACIPHDLSELLICCRQYPKQLEYWLYHDSVIRTTGPNALCHLLFNALKMANHSSRDIYPVDYRIIGFTFAFYPGLFESFKSPQALCMRMSQDEFSQNKGGDLSWSTFGQSRMAIRSRILNAQAKKIQSAWKSQSTFFKSKHDKSRDTEPFIALNDLSSSRCNVC